MSATEARATLEAAYGPGCGEPGPGYAGRFDRLFTPGVLLSGRAGVRLMDGTELIPGDPAGPYVDAYGSRAGGIAALVTIGGLEVVEYRAGFEDVPRDLALEADMRLHGIASIAGVEHAIVTTWEAGGEFGEETQFLDLLPLNGGAVTRVGVVGTVAEAAETVSFADDFFLVSESVLGAADIYALGLDGSRRQMPGLPIGLEGAAGVATLPLQRARLAPDGERFAYLRVTPGVGAGGVDVLETELVIQRLADGAEEYAAIIGGLDEVFNSLDYDGHWVVAASVGTLVVVDTWAEDGLGITTTPVSDVTAARFLDGALALGS